MSPTSENNDKISKESPDEVVSNKIPSIKESMTSMETSITDLQGELDVANKPSRNHFKPGWLLTTITVSIIFGFISYFSVMRFSQIHDNTKTIDKSCEFRNEQIIIINDKFEKLNVLIEARLKDRPDGSPNPPDVIAAFKALRDPIPLKSCKEFEAVSLSESD